MKVEEEMVWDGVQAESSIKMALFMKDSLSKTYVKGEVLSLLMEFRFMKDYGKTIRYTVKVI